MPKLKTIFLDVGGVLLTNGWDHNTRELAAKTFDIDYEEMDDRHRLTFDTFESGKISLDEYIKRIAFFKKRDFTLEQFKRFMFDQSKPFKNMLDLFASVKANNAIKIIVISNEGRELTLYRNKKFKLTSFVDVFVSSCFVHLRKPDPEIYHLAIDLAQTDLDETLYIDDRPFFVQVAQELGLPSYRHVRFNATRDKLESLGLNI